MVWERCSDYLCLNATNITYDLPGILSKREILATTHKVFDPLGIACPVTLIPKLLLQRLWKLKLPWDQEVDSNSKSEFCKWLNDLKHLERLKIPRWLNCDLETENVSLHFFCDATEAHRILVETYGDHALSETTCRGWCRCFKNNDFDVEDKNALEALLYEDSCQTLAEVAESLGVDHTIVSKRLKALRLIRKQCHWVPYKSKTRDVERHLFTCEQLFQRQKIKFFLHRIVTNDEKLVHYDHPKRGKSRSKPGHALTLSAKPNIHGSKLCFWWDQLDVVYYELLKRNETITGDRYRLQFMRLSPALKEKRPLYEQRHDKVIFAA
ncbi:Mariner Mos1 transposase [Araneus ventricosus]|uniref:Mariner Mos1 transposase n=1 Tax=Araneus ventricosus TaxID=182803 RepID=A0A4Y2LJI7_ARAVE|nr:Mariner Mos1 transposase [Araneus ventricosus]